MAVQERDVAKYILSPRGKRLIALGGYIFRRQKQCSQKSYWVCGDEKGTACKARLQVEEGPDTPVIISQTNEHNHPAKVGQIQYRIAINNMKKKAAETNDSPSEIYAKTMAEDRPPLGAMTANGTKLTSHVDRCLSVIRRAKKRSAAQKLNASLPISADRPSMVVDDPTVKRDGAGNAVPPKRFIQLGIPIASESSPGSIAPVNSHRLSMPALPADGSVVYDDHMSDKENNPIHCSGVMSSMYALQKAARFCDFFVTLLPSSYNGLTEREVFSVHKVVFGALSPRICALEKNDIKIGGNITCFGLNKVIEYAYTGNLGAIKTMSHDQVTQVSTAASALDVPMKDYIRQNRPDVTSTVAKIVVNHRETSSQSLPRSLEHHEESFAGPSGGRLKAIAGQPVTKEVIKSEPQDQSTDELAFSMFGVSSESMATDGLEALPRHPESVNGLSNNMLSGPPASVDYGSTSSAHSSKQFPACKTNIPVSLNSSTLASGSAGLQKEQSTANLWTPENISRSADRAGDAGCSKSDPDNLKNSIPVFDDSMFTS